MFDFFKKKTEAELLRDGIKKIIRRIEKHEGSYVEVCVNFVKELPNNELYKSIGFVEESKLSSTKSEVMCAALIMLSALQNNEIVDSDDGFFLEIAKHSFVYSSCIASDEDIKNLLLNPTSILSYRDNLLDKNKAVWTTWIDSDPNLLKEMRGVCV